MRISTNSAVEAANCAGMVGASWRTASSLQGVPQSPLGGYEDEPATTPAAGSLAATYLRRSMSATVQLRNYAP